MIKYVALALVLATTPVNAASMARDTYPLQQETQELRRELQELRDEVRAMKARAIRLDLNCSIYCKFGEPTEFESLQACRDSFPVGFVALTCISFTGHAGVPEN
ncbi:hypothetical protein O9X98_13885 [Agrobacterium salinitolerans]|nr:hypothetical protein [Agrobacterium salinitolerans]